MATPLKLYTYWRSQASYRVRVALRLKGLKAETVKLDLLKGEQFTDGYRALNRAMAVPTLVDGEGPPLVQSLAILEYLEETHPQPPLLPREPRRRAHVRALAQMAAVDAHPFIVPRVRKVLSEFGLDEAARTRWVRHWLDQASDAIEATLAADPRTGRFCVGDAVGLADICIVAHFVSAELFGARPAAEFPTVQRIVEGCLQMDAFALEHPLRQSDAPAGGKAAV